MSQGENRVSIALVSLNVALPSYLTQVHGVMIESGIRKQPVSNKTVAVSPTNIAGDGQGDLMAHGGPEKAVYSYPSEHWAPWTEELEPDDLAVLKQFARALVDRDPVGEIKGVAMRVQNNDATAGLGDRHRGGFPEKGNNRVGHRRSHGSSLS